MKKWALAGAFVVLSSCVSTQQPQEMNALEARIQVLEAKESENEKEIARLSKRLEQVKEEIPKIKVILSSIRQEVQELKKATGDVNLSVESLRKDLKRLEVNLSRKVEAKSSDYASSVKALRSDLLRLSEELSSLKRLHASDVSRIEEKLKAVEERLNSLRIPSVKIEKVKPETSTEKAPSEGRSSPQAEK
jgi:chromosome segregation ATPase